MWSLINIILHQRGYLFGQSDFKSYLQYATYTGFKERFFSFYVTKKF